MCAVIVTAMLILGGAATVSALSGMNIYAASFLIPLSAVPFTMHGQACLALHSYLSCCFAELTDNFHLKGASRVPSSLLGPTWLSSTLLCSSLYGRSELIWSKGMRKFDWAREGSEELVALLAIQRARNMS